MRHVASAEARPDFTVAITWREGGSDVLDFRPLLHGPMFAGLRDDPKAFVETLEIVFDGYAIGWPGERHFSADGLWYTAHPEAYARDFPDEAAAGSGRAAE
jgi:hypothetical protein